VHQTAEFNIKEHKIFLRGSMTLYSPTETREGPPTTDLPKMLSETMVLLFQWSL